MVYKKYIKKNGKLHGPYYYESYMENGVVKKRYIGSVGQPHAKKNNLVALQILLILIGILVLLDFAYLSITGSTVLEQTSTFTNIFSDISNKFGDILALDQNAFIENSEVVPQNDSDENSANNEENQSLGNDEGQIPLDNETSNETLANESIGNETIIESSNETENNETVGNETLIGGVTGNETSNETVENQTLTNLILIQAIPQIRIVKNGNFSLNLSEYFSGAQIYEFNASNITFELNGEILTIVPDLDFKGARKGIITALAGNESLESNEFNILVSSGAVGIEISRYQIKVGEPVNWTQNISLDVPENVTIELPREAENISIKKVDNEELTNASASFVSISGNVVIGIENKKKDSLIVSWFKNLLGKITGKVIDSEENASVQVTLHDNVTNYVIEYQTPGPEAFEELTSYGKEVNISASDEL